MKIVFVVVIGVCLGFSTSLRSQGADSLLSFIQNNKNDASFYLVRNDTVLASLHETKMTPLAGATRMMVAIEFAKQTAHHVFDTSKMVALNDLDKYYLAGTDGGAHQNWIRHERQTGTVHSDSISVINVARGMTKFGSDANTEYLMDILGLQNINNNYRLMGVEAFTPIDYPVASLCMYQNPKKRSENKILKEIKGLSDHNYSVATYMLHQQLKNNPAYKSSFQPQDLSADFQKLWSNRLPASTAKSYTQIAQVLNNRSIFSPETYAVLKQFFETIPQNTGDQQVAIYDGETGGMTLSVLTKTAYAKLKDGDKISFSCFFNHLSPEDNQKLKTWVNDFEQQILTNPDFVQKIRLM